MKSKWSVVTIYEGASAREAAVSFCQTLVERFWTQFDFDVTSLSFEELAEPQACHDGAHKAEAADLILFALETEDSLPWHVQSWIGSWLTTRQEHEGTLVALQTQNGPPCPAHGHLRHIAHRAGMDFLTEVPEHIPDPFADSPEFYTTRAKQVTNVLDDILRQPPPPPSF